MKNAKIKKIIPCITVVAFLCVLVAMAFVPMLSRDLPVAARSADYDPRAIAALDKCREYVAEHEFSAELTGKVKARVFGIPYTQKVFGKRSVRGGEYLEQSESSSVFVSAGLRKTAVGGKYTVAEGKSKGKKFVYGAPHELNRKDFVDAYGKPCVGLTRYEIDNAVTSAVCNDDGTFTFTLDPYRATEYYRNEIKTALGAKKYPVYSSVVITLTVDGDRPVTVSSTEKFDIDKFGGTACVATYTEEFDFH